MADDVDFSADCDENSRFMVINKEENLEENPSGKAQIHNQTTRKDNKRSWDTECKVLRLSLCFLILCLIFLQSCMDYKAFKEMEFSRRDYEEEFCIGSLSVLRGIYLCGPPKVMGIFGCGNQWTKHSRSIRPCSSGD
uniref:Uncharacterized protein LOC111134416 n=1 Tax=Crassostrea virginica TaxID=6565 RepID=A0A8B8EHI9_CRAVI|nr:uncharacterized protein LOC111134416 [Crassostrea virginica]